MKFRGMVALSCLIGTVAAQAAPIAFNFTYSDAADFGFNDPVYGAKAKAAMETAGQAWGSLLVASYVGETINIGLSFNAASTSLNPLSSSGTSNQYANAQLDNKGVANTAYTSPLAEFIAGRNLNGSGLDATLVFNPNLPIYYGNDGNTPDGQFDFLTYAYRSIARTLGINTRIDRAFATGDGSAFGEYQVQYNSATNTYIQMPSAYDRLVVNSAGVSLANLSTADRIAAVTNGDVFWGGTYGNLWELQDHKLELNAMPLNSDGTINGNVIVHADGSEFTLMSYGYPGTGDSHPIDGETAGVLKDLGWVLSSEPAVPVPEPGSYAMLLAGLGLIGLMARRRV